MNERNVAVYGLSYAELSSGVFAALPCHRQNISEYVYYGVTTEGNVADFSFFLLFVACKNNTRIEIGPITISLNEMETYRYTDQRDLTGTRVVSNKPISFFSGHECANVPFQMHFCDYLLEQIPNTEMWGKFYLVTPIFGRNSSNIYTIVSASPSNTATVFCSNSSYTSSTIIRLTSTHKTFSVPGNSSCTITSSHPVLVVQFASGQEADDIDGDPFMMTLPRVERYTNEYVVVVPVGYELNVISIVVTTDYFKPERIRVDGFSLRYENWTSILCSDLTPCGYFAQLRIGKGQHTIHHEDESAGMAVSVYSFSYHNGYGYSAVGALSLSTLLIGLLWPAPNYNSP